MSTMCRNKILHLICIVFAIAGARILYAGNDNEFSAIYTVIVAPDLSDLKVEACFREGPPEYLHTSSDTAGSYLEAVYVADQKMNGWKRYDRIDLRYLPDNQCVSYVVDLKRAATNMRRRQTRYRGNDAVFLTIAAWLWLPDASMEKSDILVRFEHPEDFKISTPWPLRHRNSTETEYRLVWTPGYWRGVTVFGRFWSEELVVPGSRLRLAILHGQPQARLEDVMQWIEHGAMALTKLYGRFPLPSPQIMVVPIGHSRGPVPWGQVSRGGGTASYLFIDQTRPITEHIDDWTLTHELSHMIHPFMGDSGSWWAEGLASYYQNVLQARIGTLSEQRAWEKLHEGFQRGIKQTRRGTSLEQASIKRGWGQIMRVYWSGAAIALLADLELRKQGKTLDFAMSEFQKCCLPSDRLWSTAEYMLKLDELTHSKIFFQLYNKYIHNDNFPDMEDAYEQLGLIPKRGKLKFNDDFTAKQLRKNIMSP